MIFTALVLFTAWLLWSCYTLFAYRSHSVVGKKVLITSASTGLGRSIAMRFADRGAKVVIWDASRERGERLADEIAHLHPENASPKSYVVDLSSKVLLQRAAREAGEVDIVVLLPQTTVLGTGLRAKSFLQVSDDALERSINGTVMGYIWCVRAFLPGMLSRRYGHIVTVASDAAFLPSSVHIDDATSQHAILGLSESLTLFLRQQSSTYNDIHTTTVFPYHTIPDRVGDEVSDRTTSAAAIRGGRGAQRKGGFFLRSQTESAVADRLVKGVCRGEETICIPFAVKLLPIFQLLPSCWFMGLMEVFDLSGTNPADASSGAASSLSAGGVSGSAASPTIDSSSSQNTTTSDALSSSAASSEPSPRTSAITASPFRRVPAPLPTSAPTPGRMSTPKALVSAVASTLSFRQRPSADKQ